MHTAGRHPRRRVPIHGLRSQGHHRATGHLELRAIVPVPVLQVLARGDRLWGEDWETAMKRRPHWYRQFIGECPVCGRDHSYRERVYGRKPKDPKKRYVQLRDTETYDHCLER